MKKHLLTSLSVILLVLNVFQPTDANAQTIRYQNNIRGGFALAANCLDLNASTFANTVTGATKMSSYSDLVLPAGSTIIKAFLYVESFNAATDAPIKSVNFKVAGATAFITLTTASTGFKANPYMSQPTGGYYCQFIVDVTALMPAGGYISTITAGGNAATTGRYGVADPVVTKPSSGAATVTIGKGWGWALYVVYTNPASKFRNVTIADACNSNNASVDIPNIIVPSTGPVNAVVGITGSFGDPGLTDNATFGRTGDVSDTLVDPTTLGKNDILNSTIGFSPNNNVTQDGGPYVSGDFSARNPYNTFTKPSHGTGTWYSYFYDADIVDASGILPNSSTPISATFKQLSNGGDVIGFGAYAISIDVVAASVTKSISPAAIQNGGIATYTFTISNAVQGAIDLTAIAFTDNLPGMLRVASPSNATLTGGSGGSVTATAGATSVAVSGLSLNALQTATLTVDVTNVAGQMNASCATNPAAFTNGYTNISGLSQNLINDVMPQCLVVSNTAVPIRLLNFDGTYNTEGILLNWKTATEQNAKEFIIERYNGTAFIQAGKTGAAGNSDEERTYLFQDKYPVPGSNYYRLKSVDLDGSFSYSNVISLHSKLKDARVLNIHFNENDLSFDIIPSNAGPIDLSLYDICGKRVLFQTGNLTANEGTISTINMDTRSIENGIYILIIEAPGASPQQVKVCKSSR